MNLEEYIEAIKHCPDSELRTKLGVTYDWPILLRTDCGSLVSDLKLHDK